MTYINVSPYWGDVGTEVTPEWYDVRAQAMGVKTTKTYDEQTGDESGVNYPTVGITRVGLVIDGVIVAVPSG